jgi:Zn-finger nucleic acid-binding protein
MRETHTASSALEVCDACEGLWLDWFDGEVHTVAVEHEAARISENPGSVPSRPRITPTPACPTCPRCARALASELYKFTDARDDELITGVELLRCAECAGAFVPRASAHLLLDRVREPSSHTAWEALVALLHGLLDRLRVRT